MGKEVLWLFVPLFAAAAAAAALYAARAVAFRLLHRWTERTATRVDDILVGALRTPSAWWCLAVGLYVGISVSELPARHALFLTKAIEVILILSAAVAAANASRGLLDDYLRTSHIDIPATGLASAVVRASIIVAGVLVALSAMGISIAPIITALGVGGLAVALALQDTLANLFAGIHLLAEKPIRVGDFVRLESGQEGYVEDITWRTTRIRMLPNNMVIIPNSKLAQSVLTNFDLPEKRMALLLPVSVAYGTDPDRLEQILLEEAKGAAKEVPGLLSEPAPAVRFIPGFGESSLDFTLICHVEKFVDQYPVQHELRKRIIRRLRAEGIEIPFPQRTVHLAAAGSADQPARGGAGDNVHPGNAG